MAIETDYSPQSTTRRTRGRYGCAAAAPAPQGAVTRRRRTRLPASFPEQLLHLRGSGHRVRPAGVEREVRDELDDLLLGHAVLDGAREMEAHLLGLAGGDERRAGDEAPVALRELRPLPDVSEQHLVGDLAEPRGQ